MSGTGSERIRPFLERNLFTWFNWQTGTASQPGASVPNPVKVGIHIDGLAVMMLFVVGFISLHGARVLHRVPEGRPALHPLLRRAVPVHGVHVRDGHRRPTPCSCCSAGRAWALCSFMLIGHWWEDKPNANAALKAFLTTRTGDIGLLVGIAMTFFLAGQTFNIEKINEAALSGRTDHTLLLLAAIALFAAVIGKSAQFPLHTWLPDAMAGPTPVSALIHAATMVVAGVYLVGRLYPRVHPGVPHPHSRPLRPEPHRHHRGGHRHHRRPAGLRAARHQEGAGLLDDQPARLHGHGPRRRARGRRPSSTSSPTPSSRPTCSSGPAR